MPWEALWAILALVEAVHPPEESLSLDEQPEGLRTPQPLKPKVPCELMVKDLCPVHEEK